MQGRPARTKQPDSTASDFNHYIDRLSVKGATVGILMITPGFTSAGDKGGVSLKGSLAHPCPQQVQLLL